MILHQSLREVNWKLISFRGGDELDADITQSSGLDADTNDIAMTSMRNLKGY